MYLVQNFAHFDVELIILKSKIYIDDLIGIRLHVSIAFFNPTFLFLFNKFFKQTLVTQAVNIINNIILTSLLQDTSIDVTASLNIYLGPPNLNSEPMRTKYNLSYNC